MRFTQFQIKCNCFFFRCAPDTAIHMREFIQFATFDAFTKHVFSLIYCLFDYSSRIALIDQKLHCSYNRVTFIVLVSTQWEEFSRTKCIKVQNIKHPLKNYVFKGVVRKLSDGRLLNNEPAWTLRNVWKWVNYQSRI